MMSLRYLYVHVPFCRSICGYCDFAHSLYRKEQVDNWMHALQRELLSKDLPDDLLTIYIGGGTPTALEACELKQLLEMLRPYGRHAAEYTIEVNPETLDEEKTELLKEYGINRVSLGLQTTDASLLKMMNRHHTFSDVKHCTDMLKQRGITNISLDLMYSLPGQTIASLKRSIHDAISLHPMHLSLYSLTIEKNTLFYAKGYQHLDDDTEADMYELICGTLEAEGYHQYEVSNFCLEGQESIHNSAYWNYEDFAGLGAGASGKEDHRRYDHTKSLKKYCEDPLLVEYISETLEDEMFNMIMMGVRMKKGMNIALFEQRFQKDFRKQYGAKIAPLLSSGLVEIKNGYFRCTDAGYEVMNSVLVELM